MNQPNEQKNALKLYKKQNMLILQILAAVFQDLLMNKDDYLRALRALFREIVRSLRYDINFEVFCLSVMKGGMLKFYGMEAAFKVFFLIFLLLACLKYCSVISVSYKLIISYNYCIHKLQNHLFSFYTIIPIMLLLHTSLRIF